MRISVKQVNTILDILVFESEITPMVGDEIAGCNFKDGHLRTIKSRQLVPNNKSNSIIVYVDYTYPSLVNEYADITQAEADLRVSNNLS